ncbi:unnamed protein product [Blepharisma stoltei]|uniref:VWFA domain-containing protein n=1 Tax=Blepharisma stoltei TaxID=1481888 RepID=A0AAU9J1Y1_9CILI|nr:unnamed protein product [Blepharisma stoltei]
MGNKSSSKKVPEKLRYRQADYPITTEIDLYNDDEAIEIRESETKTISDITPYDQKLQLLMKPALSYLQINGTLPQEMPCQLSMQASETSISEETLRQGVDIICVIDVSGSMRGPKLELTKKTLEFMVNQLCEKDRVSLIAFNNIVTRIQPLIRMTPHGKAQTIEEIRNLEANGGTDITGGLHHGIKTLEDRKIVNKISSIVLLSDGRDKQKDTSLDRGKASIDSSSLKDYSIHTFGYGSGHDAQLLSAISQLRNGGFYYVEKSESIPEAFSNCLGELMSAVADQIQVRLQTQATDVSFSLTKVYSENGDSTFAMPPVLTGDKKEAIFILSFPSCQQQFPQPYIISPVKGFIKYRLIRTGEEIEEECYLNIPVFNENDAIDSIEIDEDVMVNFYRVKSAEILKEAGELGDKGNMEGARNLLQKGADELKVSVVAENSIVKILINDLENTKGRFLNEREYEHGGKAEVMSKARGHFSKREQNVECYKNSCQKEISKCSKEYFAN